MGKKLTSSKAKKILHDKEVHGHPLTEQQRKFFGAIAGGAKPYKAESGGWLDKFDAPQAQNGIEGTMGGLTDVGFNYNGAWGGTMQMGGSLPGAVGFTYARTAGAAPANGPYAKKTKASAQNGQEMKYYQAGLDFTPKTISQKGSQLKLIPRATGDLRGPKIDVKKEQLAAAAKKNQAAREVIERQGKIKPFVPQSDASKTWEIATNPVEALGYVVRGERLPENFSKGQSRTSGLNAIVNTLNPYQIIDSGAEFLIGTGNIIKDVATGDFESASSRVPSTILQGLGAAPTLTAFPKGLGTLSDLPKARSIKEVIGRTGGVPSETSIPRMAMDEVKALRQVQEIGRLKATGARSEEQMRYALQNNLPEEHFQKVFSRSRKEAEDLLASGFGEQKGKVAQTAEEAVDRETMQMIEDFNNRPVTPELQAERDRLRAQMRQLDQRRSVSTGDVTNIDRSESTLDALERFRTILVNSPEFRTTIGNSGNVLLPRQEVVMSFVDRLADDINRSINKAITPARNINRKVVDLFNKYSQDYPYYSGDVLQKVPTLSLSAQGSLKDVSKTTSFAPEGIQSGDVFTGSLNTSHSSYLPQLKQVFKYTKGEPQFLGYRPMNDMGFLSNYGYTNEDIAKYLNSEIDEQIKRGIVPKNIQRPFLKKSLGPDRVILPQYGIRQYQEGGDIPVDSMGYWNPENVGSPVIIPSNEITMEGVDQPLLGISDTGDVQYMEPGEDYEFDGEYVTEYPLAQRGKTIPAPTTADSARLYNAQMALNKFYENEMKAGRLRKQMVTNVYNFTPFPTNVHPQGLRKANLDFYRGEINDRIKKDKLADLSYIDELYKEYFNLSPKQLKQLEYKGLAQTKSGSKYQEYYRDLITPLQNLAAPFALLDYRIRPQREISYDPYGSDYPGGAVMVYDYDPLAIKPYHMRTPKEKIEWEKQYGKKETTKPKPSPTMKKVVTKTPEPVKETVVPQQAVTQTVARTPAPSFIPPIVPSGSVGVFGPGKSRIGEYDEATNIFYPDYGNLAARSKVNQSDTDLLTDQEKLTSYIASKTGKKPKIDVTYAKQRNGGVNNADAQPLKKLDQLLNFTNYNKPTKGGWLDKYN